MPTNPSTSPALSAAAAPPLPAPVAAAAAAIAAAAAPQHRPIKIGKTFTKRHNPINLLDSPVDPNPAAPAAAAADADDALRQLADAYADAESVADADVAAAPAASAPTTPQKPTAAKKAPLVFNVLFNPIKLQPAAPAPAAAVAADALDTPYTPSPAAVPSSSSPPNPTPAVSAAEEQPARSRPRHNLKAARAAQHNRAAATSTAAASTSATVTAAPPATSTAAAVVLAPNAPIKPAPIIVPNADQQLPFSCTQLFEDAFPENNSAATAAPAAAATMFTSISLVDQDGDTLMEDAADDGSAPMDIDDPQPLPAPRKAAKRATKPSPPRDGGPFTRSQAAKLHNRPVSWRTRSTIQLRFS